MNFASRTELLIQRCIDDELSAIETKRLLDQLDSSSGGWKSLACGLLEDRQLRKLLPVEGPLAEIVGGSEVVAGTTAASLPKSEPRVAVPLRNWWAHPLTTVSLCLAIAFLGGMLVSDQQAPVVAVTDVSKAQPSVSAIPVGEQKVTLVSPGGRQMHVPIYKELQDLLQAEPNHPFRQLMEADRPLRLLMVPDSHGRTILVPMSDAPSGSLQ